MRPLPAFNVGTIVPSTRDLFQAIRTHRPALALVPLVAPEESAREALRDVEAGITAIAMNEPGEPMGEAAGATRVPMLCLRLITTKDDYLAARAFLADAVVLAPGLDAATHAELVRGSRSTRMVALDLVRSDAEAREATAAGARGLVIAAPDVPAVRAIAAKLAPTLTLIAWPARALEDDVRALVGVVDAAIVGVDVYGVTGFERLVSELNP